MKSKSQKYPLVLYYSEGWRVGYLLKRGYKWTHIRKILAYKVKTERPNIWVKTEDTKEITQ